MKGDHFDPKALIREAYVIDGITAAECRSIFLDWALGVPSDQDVAGWVQTLLDRHTPGAASHPMTAVLQQALQHSPAPRRRGGRAARIGS